MENLWKSCDFTKIFPHFHRWKFFWEKGFSLLIKKVSYLLKTCKKSRKEQFLIFPHGKAEKPLWKKMLKTPKMNFERKNEFLRKKKGKTKRDFHNPPTRNRGLFHGEGCFQKMWKGRHYKGFSGFPQNPQGIILRLRQIIYLFYLFLFEIRAEWMSHRIARLWKSDFSQAEGVRGFRPLRRATNATRRWIRATFWKRWTKTFHRKVFW